MTDLEKFIDTYKQFGIELKTHEDKDGNILITLSGETEHANRDPRFTGYIYFFSELTFSKEGKFLNQSFYE